MLAITVDDSRAVRMVVARHLREAGFTVSEAANGREAFEVLSQPNPAGENFSLALVDWNMPEMDGFELLKLLRADPRFNSLVIIMVSTETEIELLASALAAGANEYVMKPFTREILLEKIAMTGLPVPQPN